MHRDDRPVVTDSPLNDSITSALVGPHAHFAEWKGRVGRYHPDVAGLMSQPDILEAEDWSNLSALLLPGEQVALRVVDNTPPAGWRVVEIMELVQFDGSGLAVAPEPAAEVLTADDVPEMLDLVARTAPGPFRSRTIEMGTYLGVRDGSRLIAMAGERLHPTGWTEISAVCTDPEYRGQGLATRLVRAVGHGIRARGDIPFLHTIAQNTAAIDLYLALGFVVRQRSTLTVVEVG